MSYSQFYRTEEEFEEIFSHQSKITKIRNYDDKDLNLILSSENFVGTLKPVLEQMLDDELDDKRIVLIPNAGIGTEKMQMSYVYLEQFTTINNMYLKQLDILRWPSRLIIDTLKSCDVLSFSGGMVSRLLKSINEAGVREELVDIIKGGKPFIGFSAGAMSISSSKHFIRNFIGEPDLGIDAIEPLGIVNFEIYPHFEDIMLPSIKTMIPDDEEIEAYAIRENEALIITNGELLQAGNPVKIR